MGDGPDEEPFDPYERAADRAADAAEAARAARPPAGAPGPTPDGATPATSDAPDALAVRAPRYIVRKVMLGLVVLGFVMWLATSRQPQPPELAASCTNPAFKLSTQTVEKGKAVSFRIVGTEGRRYALGFDTTTFARAADGGWDAVPKAGHEDSVLVLADAKPMKGCTRTGLFATPVPLGDHTVTLYELTDDGARFIAEQKVEVVEP